MLSLNLGCGSNRISSAINTDIDIKQKPEVVADIKLLPFKSNTFERVYLFHTIEHIEKCYHERLLLEINRVLLENGQLFVSYPEFILCAQNYIDNKLGERKFWESTIYGRQLSKSDYHFALMNTDEFISFLVGRGFKLNKKFQEPDQNFNTFLILDKCKVRTYEDVIREEIF